MTGTVPQNRTEQLESVKEFIPLKTYHAIAEKLRGEAAQVQQKQTSRDAKAVRESTPQALPRDTFEERRMTTRLIRID